jgi:hypothetical protein
MRDQILAAAISAVGVVLAALIERVHRRVSRMDRKIDGLSNGTRRQAEAAIAQVLREREERRLQGMPLRRRIDRVVDPAQESDHREA